MRKGHTASQTAIHNIRARLRKDAAVLAKTHRGCPTPRGCGCEVDKSLTILIEAERQLFTIEIDSYANPDRPRREVQDDNSVLITEGKNE